MNYLVKHIILISTFVFSINAGAKGIAFKDISHNEAIELAQQENKSIFVDFYTEWCGPCKKLATSVFTNNQLGELINSNFIAICVDGDSKEAIILKEKFNITAYPTMLFLSKEGEVNRKLVGYRSIETLVSLTKGILLKSPLSEFRESFNNGNRKPSFVYAYIQELKINHLPTELIANTYLISTPIDLKTKIDLQIIIEANLHYESEISQELFKNVDAYFIENKELVAELIQQIILDKYGESFANRDRNMLAEFLPKVIDAFKNTIDDEVTTENFSNKLSELFRIEIRGVKHHTSKPTV